MTDLARVLLVDDDVRNLETLEAVLAASGCRLVRAQSADEALLALLDHDFAAIVLDIRMPGMNGLELAQLIKARKRTRHVPILFLTAHLLDEQDILRGYAVGAVDYLTKPLNPEILRSKIAVFVELYRKSRALALANDSLQREITDRERAEEALQQSKQQLEIRVQTRTAEVVHAHEVLRASEERLRLALDAGRMGTWELDEVLHTSEFDEVECALLGLPAGTHSLPLDAFYALIHTDDREAVRGVIQRARASDAGGVGAFQIEYRIVRPVDGEVRWLLARGRDVPEERRQPTRTVGVSFDITDRKQIEEALKDADHRKNDFLATLAHELRNPLAPIRNAVQILQLKGPPLPDLQSAREVIARQAQQLTRLVDDLLDISRITRDRLELRKEPVSLAAVVQAAIETSRPLIDDARHELTVTMPPESLILHADLTRLAQVISNLLNNAARYTEPGGRISLTVQREGSDAIVRVKDTGIGIPADMVPDIFEMFVQLDRSRERAVGGLGVGLALAKRLVELHEGKIEVSSDGPGTGSEFVVRLPVRVGTHPLVQPAAEPVLDSQGASLRILVVDDNRDAVESLTMLLQIMGNEVHAAHDGLEAVTAASAFRPDVVLLDIGLPRLNGYDAAKRIREESNGRRVVLIALTGWGQESDRLKSFDAGFDHHLVKPVEPTALMTLIADLSNHPAAAPEERYAVVTNTPRAHPAYRSERRL